jgi:hypothetical protein
LWNGWATPYFTLEEAQRLQADFNKGIENPMLYDVSKDAFVLKYDGDDEPYIWEGEDIQTVDGIKHLYGIGAYSHIWDECDEADKRYLAQEINDFLYDYDTYSYEDEYDDADEVIEEIIAQFANDNVFIKAHAIMNYDSAYNADEMYVELTKLLNI